MSAADHKPRLLCLTPGEPAGVGPEISLKAALALGPDSPLQLLAVADLDLLKNQAQQLGLPVALREYGGDPGPAGMASLQVIHQPLAKPSIPGQLNPENACYVLNCLDQAIALCQSSQAHALVTGPLHKGIINEAGIAFTGHTEYLAAKCRVQQVVMMLACDDFRVTLATTHLPLREVPDRISEALLSRVLAIVHQDLIAKFNIPSPRILVCGLNPHAGEGGHLGWEDQQIIKPAITNARALGIDAVGPLPADTAFNPDKLDQADTVLAMYHDQGLPVLKHAGFGRAVNITLGLPIIRTSVDHGTAVDIAGQGIASPTSLLQAIYCAAGMKKS